jgi:hypothetical protein
MQWLREKIIFSLLGWLLITMMILAIGHVIRLS